MEQAPPLSTGDGVMDELVADFVCEAAEGLGGLLAGIARLAADGVDRDASGQMLRRLHGLKGLCGFVSFRRCEALIHAGESLLSGLAEAPASPLALARLARLVERLSELLTWAAEHQAEPEGDDAELIASIEGATTGLKSSPWPVPVIAAGAEPAGEPFHPDFPWIEAGRPETERRTRAPWIGLDSLAQALGDRLGKRIELVVGGDDLRIAPEAARPLRLALIALVRNACDHGVECPAERRAAGKATLSILRLSVHRQGEGAIIELADDGRGVDPEQIRAQGVACGRLAPSAAGLDAAAIDSLVFSAGFSTAEAIDSISGRGLGLGLVRSELEGLGGTVSMTSIPGQGARFVLNLPATAVATPAARGRAAA